MTALKTIIWATAGLTFSAVSSQAVLSLNFASTLGSTIQFNGSASSFQFNSSTIGIFSGTQWQIGSETGGTGVALGLFGQFSNGPFTYGAITTSGNLQTAAVTGPLAALQISDGSGNLTGNINWVQISTLSSAGGINAGLQINVTGLTYTGSNADLAAMLNHGGDALDLTFQFSPGETLSQLSTGSSPFATSYSGSLSAVPETNQAYSIAFLLTGLGVVAGVRRLTKPAASR